MRTLLICHADDPLTHESMARWLASFSSLVGVVLIDEPAQRVKRRVLREIERVGYLRFLDVLAWRVYSRVALGARDTKWRAEALQRVRERFAPIPDATAVQHTESPNTDAVREFIAAAKPDLMVARCKSLLKSSIFKLPAHGTLVMHPGICPEYRNAHGCFWALASGDDDNVGMTLLKIDKGIDTGPVYGYYRYRLDPLRDTPSMINDRVVLENLDALREKFAEIAAGKARPIETGGRSSAEWGQPWLSSYLRWQWRARRGT